MNAKPVYAITANNDDNEIIQRSDSSAEFADSPHFACHYAPNEAVLQSPWKPRGIPSFNADLLHDSKRGSQIIKGYFFGSENIRPLEVAGDYAAPEPVSRAVVAA